MPSDTKDSKKKMTQEEFNEFHDDLILRCLKYTDNLAEQKTKSVSWTLTNDFTVTFRDNKRKARV